MSSSQPNSGPANAVSPTHAAQSPQGTVGAQSQPPGPATSATHPVASSVPNAGQPVALIGAQELQAAQLEHTLGSPADPNVVHGSSEPSNCAPAGGASAPQSPVAGWAPSPAKKRRCKRHDNHVSVRFSDDINDVIARRMARTGEKQSDAVRAIIRESEHTTGHVYIAPKAPPEQLEVLLGLLSKWRRDFATAKPRLNIPTPAADDGRFAEVQKWRGEANRLLQEIPKLETAVTAALRAVTSLTPERVKLLKNLNPLLETWLQSRITKGEGEGATANAYRATITLIEDMGITERGGK